MTGKNGSSKLELVMYFFYCKGQSHHEAISYKKIVDNENVTLHV